MICTQGVPSGRQVFTFSSGYEWRCHLLERFSLLSCMTSHNVGHGRLKLKEHNLGPQHTLPYRGSDRTFHHQYLVFLNDKIEYLEVVWVRSEKMAPMCDIGVKKIISPGLVYFRLTLYTNVIAFNNPHMCTLITFSTINSHLP